MANAGGYDSSFDAAKLYNDNGILDVGSLKVNIDGEKEEEDFQSIYTKSIPVNEYKKPSEDGLWWIYAGQGDKNEWHFYASSRKFGVIRFGELKYREHKLLKKNPFTSWDRVKVFPVHRCSTRSEAIKFAGELFKQCSKPDFYHRVRDLADSVADSWRKLLDAYSDRKNPLGGPVTSKDILLYKRMVGI